MKWINILHLYQPPTQSREVVDMVVSECYELIIELINKYPKLKLTLNITGSLLVLLEEYGHTDLINEYARLVKQGRIELLASAMYHPIIPLINLADARRQIELNTKISRKYFGDTYRPSGFYLPEMAYSDGIGRLIKELGFKWLILDPIHINLDSNSDEIIQSKIQTEPYRRVTNMEIKYRIKSIGLPVIFRNSYVSSNFPPEVLVRRVEEKTNNSTIITVHDAEMYGHRHKNDNGYYRKAFESKNINSLLATEYFGSLNDITDINLRSASWESKEDELRRNIPFFLWNSPENKIQQSLWQLFYDARQIIFLNQDDHNFKWSLDKLDKSMASCAWWWASGRKIGSFSPRSWNPTEVEKGAMMILESVRTLNTLSAVKRMKIEAEFSNLHNLIWKTHWQDYHRG